MVNLSTQDESIKELLSNPEKIKKLEQNIQKTQDLINKTKARQQKESDMPSHVIYKVDGETVAVKYNVFDYPSYPKTEMGIAQRVCDMMQDHLIYNQDLDRFYLWSGRRWVPMKPKDATLFQLIKGAVDMMGYDDRTGGDYNKIRNSMLKVHAMRDIATILEGPEMLGQTGVQFDTNSNLNCMNGEINLLTGKLEKHDKNHHHTKMVRLNYDPSAKCPHYLKALSTSFQGNKEMMAYFVKCLAYGLYRGNLFRHFFILYGQQGHQGKNLLLDPVAKILGFERNSHDSYGDYMDFKQFAKGPNSGSGSEPNPALVGLKGTRMLVTSEPQEGMKLSSGLVKSLTGDSVMKPRGLQQDPIAFKPQMKLYVSTNHMPRSEADSAIMSRLVIIPFVHSVKIGSLEDDPDLKREIDEELPGVFALMVKAAHELAVTRQQRDKERKAEIKKQKAEAKKGNKDYTRKPIFTDPLLPYPKEVAKARNNYVYGSNSVSQFLSETLMSKQAFFNYLTAMILPDTDKVQSALKAYASNTGNGYVSPLTAFQDKLFKNAPQYLVADPEAYTLKSDIYKLYLQWCHDNGVKLPSRSHSFYEKANSFLISGRLASGRVYLGVAMTPTTTRDYRPQGHNSYLKAIYNILSNSGKYDSSLITKLDYEGKIGSRKLYDLLRDDKKNRLSKGKQDKVKDAFGINPHIEMGNMLETINGGYGPIANSYDDTDYWKQKEAKQYKATHLTTKDYIKDMRNIDIKAGEKPKDDQYYLNILSNKQGD